MTFPDGFAEPIIWGAKEGYTIPEIAAGLMLDAATVMAVIESRSPVRFPKPVRRQLRAAAPKKRPPRLLDVPALIDTTRKDPAYLVWRRQRHGASETLREAAR
jgi:hypothetical protein